MEKFFDKTPEEQGEAYANYIWWLEEWISPRIDYFGGSILDTMKAANKLRDKTFFKMYVSDKDNHLGFSDSGWVVVDEVKERIRETLIEWSEGDFEDFDFEDFSTYAHNYADNVRRHGELIPIKEKAIIALIATIANSISENK